MTTKSAKRSAFASAFAAKDRGLELETLSKCTTAEEPHQIMVSEFRCCNAGHFAGLYQAFSTAECGNILRERSLPWSEPQRLENVRLRQTPAATTVHGGFAHPSRPKFTRQVSASRHTILPEESIV